jgi:hypothetical protein
LGLFASCRNSLCNSQVSGSAPAQHDPRIAHSMRSKRRAYSAQEESDAGGGRRDGRRQASGDAQHALFPLCAAAWLTSLPTRGGGGWHSNRRLCSCESRPTYAARAVDAGVACAGAATAACARKWRRCCCCVWRVAAASATLQSHMTFACAADARHKRGAKQARAAPRETEAPTRVEW